MSGMGFPNDPTFYGEDLPLVPRTIPTTPVTVPTTTYAQAVLDHAEGRICTADLDKAEQVATTAHEEEQSFLTGMMSDYIEDLQRTAARTTGINRKFFLTVAEKLA